MLPETRGVARRVPERADRPRGGRHRAAPEPSQARRVLRNGAITALVGGGFVATAMPAHAATADDFAKLRQCESGGNYSINTGNGFYGAYQFDLQTWHGLGYSGLPSDAPPALQDQAAYKLYDSRGWAPWPSCSAQLGLTNNGAAPAAPAAPAAAAPAAAPNVSQSQQQTRPAEPALTLQGALAKIQGKFQGTVLSTRYADEARPDTLVWQNQMRRKSFMLTVDGKFGAQSQGVASLYSYLTRVDDGQPGVVGKNLWGITVGDAI